MAIIASETWQTVSRDIVLTAPPGVVTQFRAGIYIDPTGVPARVDVRSILIEDVTVSAAADKSAKAAAGFASSADAKATEAGQGIPARPARKARRAAPGRRATPAPPARRVRPGRRGRRARRATASPASS